MIDFRNGQDGLWLHAQEPNQTGASGCGKSVTLKAADLKAVAEARAIA
ncbi:hypothetical protein N8D56_27580 (plasmid) [Devosia sp. A8/3-2]|nr:hypothetical protein N8D56_27580 [Devosia sp. A8/3-2]